MGLFINKLKLKAAANSMHQFCPRVQGVFPIEVNDEVVEASTLFLYLQMTKEILGRRFASHLTDQLMQRIRSPRQILISRVARLSTNVQTRGKNEEYHEFITRVISCLLLEAGCPTNDQGVLRECFMAFQEAVNPMKEHLIGIKNQNTWVLRQAA